MLPSLTSTAACRVRAWESLASSAARATICSASWLSARFSGRHCGPLRPGSGSMRNTVRETSPEQAAQRRMPAGHGTLRHLGDTPCDLDICDTKALKGEHQRCADIPDRKATPMLPEPTIPKRRAASPAPQPWVMTPLFCVPDEDEPVPVPAPGVSGRRAARSPGRGRRASPRGPASRPKRDGQPDPPDLLAITAQRLRLALARSFLRYGIPGDLEAAVHAAM